MLHNIHVVQIIIRSVIMHSNRASPLHTVHPRTTEEWTYLLTYLLS